MEHKENTNVHITINRPIRFIHFSDGVDEEIEQETVNELNSTPRHDDVNPKSLPWMPWFSYHVWKTSSKMLNVVDYAGEGLANFFGITTPKFQIEINEYERIQEEKKRMEDECSGWVPKTTGGDIPLVLSEPLKGNEITNIP